MFANLFATRRRHRAMCAGAAAFVTLLTSLAGVGAGAVPAQAATLVNGSGSTYVALAMDDWVRSSQVRGIRVNYTAIGSPAGVGQYSQQQTDFAGTEAEWSSLNGGRNTPMDRGFQYVPDVAGAIAMMYNLRDAAGKKVDWLHLDQRTISRIFTGDIKRWSDPAITATNGGRPLPDQPIRVVYRSGQSGTTALFYDFVREAARDIYEPWRNKYNFHDGRIIELNFDFGPTNPVGQTSSDGIAQFIGSSAGLWSIGYDEFGYAKKHGVETAWVKNGAGQWVLPFAENIAEALKDARLRPDLSQELSGVYTSKRPKAYPISAYSYLMTQCRPSPDRSTCRGPYPDAGVTDTMAKFMRYIACDGQAKMARIGYSPLPPNLSQEMVNSIARITGEPAERLTPGNCNNPTFRNSLGEGAQSVSDPFTRLPGGVQGATGGGPARTGATGVPSAGAAPSASATAVGIAGGGSGKQQAVRPVDFTGPDVPGLGLFPLLLLLAVIVVPPIVIGINRAVRKPRRLSLAPRPDATGPLVPPPTT